VGDSALSFQRQLTELNHRHTAGPLYVDMQPDMVGRCRLKPGAYTRPLLSPT
jgi:hypothetical protein